MRKQPTDCPTRDFKNLMREVGMLMAFAVTQEWPLVQKENPVFAERAGQRTAEILGTHKPVIVPILRAGLVMADGMNEIIQTTYTGHLGIYHEINQQPELYLVTLPNDIELAKRRFIIVDPTISRGSTACMAISTITQFGVERSNIYFVTILTSQEGLDRIESEHSGVHIYYADIDELENTRLKPGFGSVSARLFRTE
jgi:uracil phosphoribosyltransferase